jgi:thiol-disulfide isomerase/thioredoxin
MEGNKALLIITIVLVLLFFGAIGYALISEQGFIVSEESGTLNLQGQTVIEDLPDLPIIRKAPEIDGIHSWINSDPLTLQELQGKVVLIDFWTYSCINCIRTLPHTRGWYEKYKDNGFVILGVHTPEFEFEKKEENVLTNIEKYSLTYPIALDNDYKTWRAFENRFWPAHYLIDAKGNIRFTHFGEGRYAATEMAIQKLLLEAGLLPLENVLEPQEPASQVDFQQIGTPELYLGASRISNIGNPIEGIRINEPHDFTEPEEVEPNKFYFAGTWRIAPEFSEFVGDEGKIVLQYLASKVNIVLDTKDTQEIFVEIKLDGEYLTDENKGDDVVIENGKSTLRVLEPRLYNVVNTKDMYEMHTVEIIINSSGLQAFAFTFG